MGGGTFYAYFTWYKIEQPIEKLSESFFTFRYWATISELKNGAYMYLYLNMYVYVVPCMLYLFILMYL